MINIQGLDQEDIDQILQLKSSGEISFSPLQIQVLLRKAEQTLENIQNSTLAISETEYQSYIDLATTVGAIGIAYSQTRLQEISALLQNTITQKLRRTS